MNIVKIKDEMLSVVAGWPASSYSINATIESYKQELSTLNQIADSLKEDETDSLSKRFLELATKASIDEVLLKINLGNDMLKAVEEYGDNVVPQSSI